MPEEKVLAKDCKCVDCGKKAVCFWPVCDPDIPSYPYCRKCVDDRKDKLMLELSKIECGNFLKEGKKL